MSPSAVVLLCLALACAAPAALTGVGARRRGAAAPLVLASAVAFPIAWAAWYVRDERPWSHR